MSDIPNNRGKKCVSEMMNEAFSKRATNYTSFYIVLKHA